MSFVVVEGLSKSYGDAKALYDASLRLERGEIHAVLGENGAGKSTLVKALSGIVVPDTGRITIGGSELRFGSPAASLAAGVSTAFQELSLLPNLSVAENLLLGNLPTRAGIVSGRAVRARARVILKDWGVEDVDPGTPVSRLPLSTKQRLEIVRALHHRPGLLILDEPTAALPDTAWLFHHVRVLRDQGTAVLYISHKLPEIRALCDGGTLLRNGEVVGSFEGRNFDNNDLISRMIGRSVDVAFPPRRTPFTAEPDVVLDVKGLKVADRLRSVDLQIRRGEILGVAALEGQGQRDLFYGLAGATKADGGTVLLEGKPARISSPRAAMRSGPGIALIPEERKREGIFADLPTRNNITVPVLSSLSKLSLLRRKAESNVAHSSAEKVNLAARFLPRNVGNLSGGNQQKAILARTALGGARCLLMFDPTRGIDASAKFEIYGLLREASEDGAATLIYSTEIPELVGLCDRVLVLYAGRIVAEFAGDEIREGTIMAAAVGHATDAPPTTALPQPSAPTEVPS